MGYGLRMGDRRRDLVYPPVIVTARAGFKALGLRFRVSGTEHVPRTGGAVLAFNHISYVDFILGGYAALPSRRLVRFMAKESVFRSRLSGPLMRGMAHLPVDRAHGELAARQALRVRPRPGGPSEGQNRRFRSSRSRRSGARSVAGRWA